MRIGETFQTNGIKYSIVNVFRREVRIGTGIFNDSFPNAINLAYDGILRVPNFVVHLDKVWCIVEIGTCAFAKCESITSVKIGYNIEIVKQKAFFRCYNIQNITFESHSRLKILEFQAFYDLYNIKNFELGGDRLQIIGNDAFGFSKQLKYFRFPPSVTFLDFQSLRGWTNIERIDYCGKSAISQDVFNRDSAYPITSKGVNILSLIHI